MDKLAELEAENAELEAKLAEAEVRLAEAESKRAESEVRLAEAEAKRAESEATVAALHRAYCRLAGRDIPIPDILGADAIDQMLAPQYGDDGVRDYVAAWLGGADEDDDRAERILRGEEGGSWAIELKMARERLPSEIPEIEARMPEVAARREERLKAKMSEPLQAALEQMGQMLRQYCRVTGYDLAISEVCAADELHEMLTDAYGDRYRDYLDDLMGPVEASRAFRGRGAVAALQMLIENRQDSDEVDLHESRMDEAAADRERRRRRAKERLAEKHAASFEKGRQAGLKEAQETLARPRREDFARGLPAPWLRELSEGRLERRAAEDTLKMPTMVSMKPAIERIHGYLQARFTLRFSDPDAARLVGFDPCQLGYLHEIVASVVETCGWAWGEFTGIVKRRKYPSHFNDLIGDILRSWWVPALVAPAEP